MSVYKKAFWILRFLKSVLIVLCVTIALQSAYLTKVFMGQEFHRLPAECQDVYAVLAQEDGPRLRCAAHAYACMISGSCAYRHGLFCTDRQQQAVMEARFRLLALAATTKDPDIINLAKAWK